MMRLIATETLASFDAASKSCIELQAAAMLGRFQADQFKLGAKHAALRI